MALVFIMVLSFIGIVYIKNDMYYINPLLNILGYSYYEIEFKDETGTTKSAKAFFNGQLELNQKYNLCTKYSNLFFIKRCK